MMDLTVIVDDHDQVLTIRVDAEARVETVKALVQADTGIAASEQQLHFNQHLLADDQQTLASAGVKNNDFLQVSKVTRRSQQASTQQSQSSRSTNNVSNNQQSSAAGGITPDILNDPARLQQHFKSQPALLEQLQQAQPELARAIMSDTPDQLRRLLEEQQAITQRRSEAELRRIRLLNEDPFSEEAQSAIEEEIRLAISPM
jgi:Na+/phosphate symporter